MIQVKRDGTGDSRTCNFVVVRKEELIAASHQHICDVQRGLAFFAARLLEAAIRHDWDKIEEADNFFADFRTGFRRTEWWERHQKVNRHHLDKENGIPEDVNLVDVLDHIVDCVMAGSARSGWVYDLHLPDALLQRAFQNTVAMIKAEVEIVEAFDASQVVADEQDEAP
jgi:hypothetical protein